VLPGEPIAPYASFKNLSYLKACQERMAPPGDMRIIGENILNDGAVTVPTYGAHRDLGVFKDLEL
jgi:hypothetical protein